MLRIGGDFLDFGFSYVSGKIFFDRLYAIINFFRGALGEHLDGAARQVTDKTGELMAIGHPMRGKAKTDALHAANENYASGNHV